MVALVIIGLMFGLVFTYFNPDSDSDKMKKATVKLEALSARGHSMAMLHQKPFWLRFERNRVILQGAELASVDTSGGGFGDGAEGGRGDDGERRSNIVSYETFDFPEGIDVFVRRWGAAQNEWFHQENKEDPVIFWNFTENGLCEPISLRLEIEKSWIELEMDPLTALVSDETSELYD